MAITSYPIYRYQHIMKQLTSMAIRVRAAAVANDQVSLNSDSQLFIYGELFGGVYPHKDVESIADTTPV